MSNTNSPTRRVFVVISKSDDFDAPIEHDECDTAEDAGVTLDSLIEEIEDRDPEYAATLVWKIEVRRS